MRCIDFDKEFERYVIAWIKEHGKEYKNYDAMEAEIPKVYETFLDTPMNWLMGAKPGEYFAQFDDARQLVHWMEDYFRQRIPVPDMLMNRIGEMGADAQDALMNALHKEKATQEMRMAVVTLLREIGSLAPMQCYIDWQAKRSGPKEDELADNALESLASMGESAVPAMREALPSASPDGQEALLTLLCDYPGDERVLQCALTLFETPGVRIAVIADCLGRLGDERALPLLKAKAASEETEYLDYIELRNAIEELGGEAPEREFDAADPAYDAMRSMQ